MLRALQDCWIHDCGSAFVAEADTKTCPGCGAAVAISSTSTQLKIQILPNGPRFGTLLKEGQPIILGRKTMAGLPPTVSARHLEILPMKGKLLLRHVGSNPTLIEQNGQLYRLEDVWLDHSALQAGLRMMLAEVELELLTG